MSSSPMALLRKFGHYRPGDNRDKGDNLNKLDKLGKRDNLAKKLGKRDDPLTAPTTVEFKSLLDGHINEEWVRELDTKAAKLTPGSDATLDHFSLAANAELIAAELRNLTSLADTFNSRDVMLAVRVLNHVMTTSRSRVSRTVVTNNIESINNILFTPESTLMEAEQEYQAPSR
jgi:hypothetical protein